MAESVDDNQKDAIEEAVQQFIDAQLQGREPDIDEFVKRYPEIEDKLRQRIRKIQKIDDLFDSIVQVDENDFEDKVIRNNLIGRKLGGFEIVKVIGRGGMGVVYLAHDTKLDRSVAIKSIPAKLADDSTTRMRFHREAKLLASLNHPNIAVIHEIIEQDEDLSYLVLEYVPGESLAQRIAREPLKVEQALSIALQIAEAVSAAHEKGVIHRDLKPGNIKLTPEGRVKVLDFGLAKPSVSEGTDIEITSTEPGHIIGTPAYMSPEQARGNPTDHRTDIWSFGCIIYQMLTGHSPFESDTATDTLARIIERQPDWELLPNETPENIRVLLRHCLEKNQDKRLGDIADAGIEISETLSLPATTTAAPARTLWRWAMAIGLVAGAIVVGLNIGRWREQLPGGVSPGRVKSLAVLPLENLSGDPEQEYFADGMTGSLITELSKIGALRVISRQSVMRYKGSDKPLPEIAQELNVDAVVEGSVLRVAERVRITAQLISAVPERHLWADNYDRYFGDILILSSEVAQAIAHEIQVILTPEEEARLTSARHVNPEAHDLYLRGLYHYNKDWTVEEFEKAIDYFQKTIEADPNHALAYAGLARSYEWLCYLGHLPLEEAHAKFYPMQRKALEIDDTLLEAHLALAKFRFYEEWDWAGARTEFKRAIEINPKSSEARYEYAWFLMAMGHFTEAIVEARYALQSDPFSYPTNFTLLYVYYHAREFNQAEAQWQQMNELGLINLKVYSFLARIYEQMGRYEDAVKACQKALTLSDDPPEKVADIAAELERAYSESGPTGYWMWRLEKLKGQYEHDPYFTAQIYAQLGDKEQAFAWLEKAYKEHRGPMYLLKVNPCWDPLRNDPRFGDLMRRMNFPE